jgi:anti-sigma regulatory factor (Ser/Thr protein kinase)/ABC-type transporter Mla MlaB component
MMRLGKDWRQMAEVTCKIDFNVNDSFAPVRVLIERVEAMLEIAGLQPCHIDLSRCQYLGPDAVALLAAVIDETRLQGRSLRVTLPEAPAKLRGFCRFSGLEAAIKGTSGSEEASQTVVPLRQILRARFTDAEPIIRLVHRQLDISEESEEYLRICVNEVVQNIEDHAESRIGGIMSARYLGRAREVRVAIVDRGLGIYATLKRRYPDTTEQNMLRRVLRGKFTALSRENNAGLGLCNLSSMIEHLRGQFVIVSDRAAVIGQADANRKFVALRRRFSGTAVFFTLPMMAR